jgi:hypothetical protein
MSALQNLKEYYLTNGKEKTRELLSNFCLVTERFSSVSFHVRKTDSELSFYKKDGRFQINQVDRVLNRIYESALAHFENLELNLPDSLRFQFDYFPSKSPARVGYDKLPHNKLILNRIFETTESGKTKRVIEDPSILSEWAKTFDVDFNRPLACGNLTEEQIENLLDVLESENILLPEMICRRVFKRTPKLSENFAGIDSLLFRFFTDNTKKPVIYEVCPSISIHSINESKQMETDKSAILLIDFMDFMRSRNLSVENLKNKQADKRYVELMGDLFVEYANARKSLSKMDLKSNKFSGDIFEINKDLLENSRIKEVLEDENLQRAFQIILNSFRKRKSISEADGLFDNNTIAEFNRLVERISKITSFIEEKDFMTFSDFREIKGMNESKVIEEKKKFDQFQTVLNSLVDLGYAAKVNYKHGQKHIRAALKPTAEETRALLENFSDKIDIIPADQWKEGSLSGKYSTFRMLIENEEIVIVNQKTERGNLKPKELTPSTLGVPTDTKITAEQLEQIVLEKIESNYSHNQSLKNFLDGLLDDVKHANIQDKYNTLGHTGETFDEIFFSEKTQTSLQGISSYDLACIGKDFGEILGALYLSNMVDITEGIEFPGGNNPLVDFKIDDFGVSSKYKDGATATLTGIISTLNESTLQEDGEKKLKRVFDIVQSNGVAESYLRVAEFLKLPGYIMLEEMMGEVTLEKINDRISKHHTGTNQEIEDNIWEDLSPLFSIMGRSVAKPFKVDKIQEDKRYGYVIGPLSYHVADHLNSKPEYVSALKGILNRFDVRQLYLDFKGDRMSFKMRPFDSSDNNFIFTAPNQSAYNPGNGRLGFALK